MANIQSEYHVTFTSDDLKESNRKIIERNINKNTKAKNRKSWLKTLKSDNCTTGSTNTMQKYNKKHGKGKRRKSNSSFDM